MIYDIYRISAIFPAVSFILCALILVLVYPLSKKRVESNVVEL
ncbi:MAG: hypothetical protein ACI4BB_12115 [Coprococcus sp.]